MSIKSWWDGKPLHQVYAYPTRFQVFKYRVRRFFHRVLKVITVAFFILAFGYFIFRIGQSTNVKTIYAVQEKEVMTDNLSPKIRELKDNLLATLIKCESGGHSTDKEPIIIDTNGKPSVGDLKYQLDTIVHYWNVLYKEVITQKQALLIALDTEKASKLAEDIWFNTKAGAKDWYNCDMKHSLSTQISFIKKLTQ